MKKANFRPKQPWQKDNCLFCDKPATLEATFSKGNNGASIRCCENPECKRKAAVMARSQVNQVVRAFFKKEKKRRMRRKK